MLLSSLIMRKRDGAGKEKAQSHHDILTSVYIVLWGPKETNKRTDRCPAHPGHTGTYAHTQHQLAVTKCYVD